MIIVMNEHPQYSTLILQCTNKTKSTIQLRGGSHFFQITICVNGTTVNPLLTLPPPPPPREGLIYSEHIWGQLIWEGGLIQLSKSIVLYKIKQKEKNKLEYKVIGGLEAKDTKQTSSWWIKLPGSVHTKFYNPNWLMQSIFICK